MKFIDRQVRSRHFQAGESFLALHTAVLPHNLQALELANHPELSTIEGASLPLDLLNSGSSCVHLDIPSSSNDSLRRNTAMPSINHTPGTSHGTSRPSSSDRASLLTPESSSSVEESLTPSESDVPLTRNPNLLGEISDVEAYTPALRRASQTPHRVPQGWMHGVIRDDHTLAGQIIDEVMGFSSPSTFSIPRPNETFQNLMRAPIADSVYQLDEFRHKLRDMREIDHGQETLAPQPETWITLCLCINVLRGQARTLEASHAEVGAAMIYQRLVQERNDQILAIPNFVLANLFLHGKEALAAQLLSQAHMAASLCLDDEDPIMVSIGFMISMALKKVKSCGIKILKLRQVAEKMKVVWGPNHRYCITADYHVAWRLAMEPDLRLEALKLLRQTQARAEKVFDPLHMQTIALITTQARVLGHLGHQFEAERTMFEALQRIEKWDITEDHPYYLEAKRRHKIFLDELDRVRSR